MPGGKPFLEFFKANVDDQLESYDELPEAEKYGNNGTFVKFHQRIWEAQNPGKQFDRRRMFGQSTGNEEESDEDIEMVAVQENIRCPLSGQVMTEPYTSRVCNHSYSPAIIEYINQCSGDRRDAECPFPGCNHIVSLDNLAKNKPLARKIAKIQATMSSTQGNEDYSIDDDEE
ncbi:hypothetical protein BJ742DRAFT_681377 [Cladochytrium replicatum]|nr:hypothetical protein BJ742DRAFT_681377 [Cladochytrium replicatum]